MKEQNFRSNLRLASKCRQRGAFAIEFAMVGVFFAALLVFSSDIVVKLATKGKLDRLTYSLVNVLKERTQLYDDVVDITKSDASSIDRIAQNSLRRTMGNFEYEKYGIVVEEQSFSGVGTGTSKPLNSYRFGGYACTLAKPLSALKEMSVVSSWNRQVPIYRVTLCYKGINWFGDMVGLSKEMIASDAILIGR